jgi:hypothetical protein
VTAPGEGVRILARLRRYLERQRQGLHAYLRLLEQERAALGCDDADRLLQHIQLEGVIVAELRALQKAIDPLDPLYRRAYPAPERSIEELQRTVGRLREEVLESNRATQRAVAQRLEVLRGRIRELRRHLHGLVNSPYGEIAEPSLIDIRS